jgi:hypothetical protein
MKTTLADKEELNLITLAQEYADEDKARQLLESMLWPDFMMPDLGSVKFEDLVKKMLTTAPLKNGKKAGKQ